MNDIISQDIYLSLPSFFGVLALILMEICKYRALKKTNSIEEYHEIDTALLPWLAIWISGVALLIYGLTLPTNITKTITLLIMVTIQILTTLILSKKKKRLKDNFLDDALYKTILTRITNDVKTGNYEYESLLEKIINIGPKNTYNVIKLALDYDSNHDRILEKEQNADDQALTIFKILKVYLESKEGLEVLKGNIPETNVKLDIDIRF